MEWFDRYDHQRIPMVPKAIPSAAVPIRMRWHVTAGIAYPGDGGETVCYVPHPAFCPMADHGDEDDSLQLALARAHFRKRSDALVTAGLFIPDLRIPRQREEEVAEQYVEVTQDVRHVIAYGSVRWLAPGSLELLQCVALADRTGERCGNLVWNDEGLWEESEIPHAPGRAGQDVLWAGTTMWAYALHALYPDELSRWMKQRCTWHAKGYQPDAVPPQWVLFDVLRHSEHILREPPAGVLEKRIMEEKARAAGLFPQPTRTKCSGSGCGNGTVSRVPEGWLCGECERVRARREQTDRRWTIPRSPVDGG